MKSIFAVVLIVLITLSGSLMAEPWRISSDASLSFNQSSYSDNWAGTELGTISWTAKSTTIAEKQLSEILNNKTTFKLSYGQTHQQKTRIDSETGEEEKHWGKPEKSTDKIDLESLFRFTLHGYVDPFLAARWESQFLDLRYEDETYIINPHRFTESAGVIRNFINEPNHSLSARIGAAFRQQLDRNEEVRQAETMYDGGIEFIAEYMKRFLPQDILYNSRLQVYQALFNSEEDELVEDHWKRVDVKWENTLSTRIWSIINASLFFETVYEREKHKNPQFRQTLGLGIFFQLY